MIEARTKESKSLDKFATPTGIALGAGASALVTGFCLAKPELAHHIIFASFNITGAVGGVASVLYKKGYVSPKAIKRFAVATGLTSAAMIGGIYIAKQNNPTYQNNTIIEEQKKDSLSINYLGQEVPVKFVTRNEPSNLEFALN